jgi:hypothetical protein
LAPYPRAAFAPRGYSFLGPKACWIKIDKDIIFNKEPELSLAYILIIAFGLAVFGYGQYIALCKKN